jgi:hypothetical protein
VTLPTITFETESTIRIRVVTKFTVKGDTNPVLCISFISLAYVSNLQHRPGNYTAKIKLKLLEGTFVTSIDRFGKTNARKSFLDI